MNPGGKIGFLDSGTGGLLIARSVVAQLPDFNYVYLGDTSHQPYDALAAADIRSYAQQGVTYLFDQGCELVILTSNGMAAQALDFLQRQFLPSFAPHRHVLGAIVPAAEAAVMATKNNLIGVLAPPATVESHSFAEEIQKLRPEAAVYQQPAPDVAQLISAGLHESTEMDMMLRHYIAPLAQAGIDTLVLGDTLYERVSPRIAQLLGPGVTVVHQPAVVAERLQDYLFRHADLSHKLAQGSERRFCFTSNAAVFAGLGRELYGEPFTAEDVVLK